MCPPGTRAFFFLLFWPPARRAADGGLLGAAAPPRPPLHSPRTTPLGLSYIPYSHGLAFKGFYIPPFHEGCAAIAAGASSLRSAISLRAAQCQRALSPCAKGRKRFAYPPHAQREGYACSRGRKAFSAGVSASVPLDDGIWKPWEQSGGAQRGLAQSVRSTAAPDRPHLLPAAQAAQT